MVQIVLDQKEIEKALLSHIGHLGISLANKHVSVTLVPGKELSAAISISGEPVTSTSVAAPVGPAVQTASIPAPAPKVEETVDLNRDRIKAELDRRGIEYAPKAHTPTLQGLLEEAQAKEAAANQFAAAPTSAPAVVVETTQEDAPLFGGGGIFGAPAEPVPATPKEPVKETPPFDVDDDDNRPLFGS